MKTGPLLSLVTLTLLTLAPSLAWATPPCVDFWPHGDAASLLPQQQETGVPTDTRLWFGVTGARETWEEQIFPSITLRDEAGDDVALGSPRPLGAGSSRMVSWQPVVELQPLMTYTLEASWPPADEFDDPPDSESWSQIFVTGEGPSLTGPAVPTLQQLDMETYPNDFDASSCYSEAPRDRVQAAVGGAARIHVLFMAEEPGQDGPPDPFEGGSAAAAGAVVEIEGELPPASAVRLRAGALDLAGDFSGWSEEQTATMPAAGCASTKTLDEAALGLALLLLGGGLLRRKDLRRLAPVALAGLLCAATVAPTIASAEETSGAIEAATAPAVEVDLSDWRAPIAGRLATAERVWGGLAIAGGAAQLGFALALPFRAPGALSGTVGSVVGWGPALSGLLTTAAIRHHLLRTVSAERLEKALWAGFFVTIGVCAAAFVGAGVGGVLTLLFVDGSGGPFASMVGGALSVLSMNITLGVYAGQMKRARARGAAVHRRPPPEVLAAGPTGLVLAF